MSGTGWLLSLFKLPDGMQDADSRPARIVNGIAAIVALVVTFSLPWIYFALTYIYQASALETTAEIKAHIVTELIDSSPTMWRYQDRYLTDLLERGPAGSRDEGQRILDVGGRVIVESGEKYEWPMMKRSQPLLDSGDVVGSIEVRRSMRPLLVNTVLVSILGLVIGSAVFIPLRVLPLRALRRAQESLFQEKERAQITLRSIVDGVIATDLSGRIVLFNKAAEELTGWTGNEAEGRPLAEVFPEIDGKNREPVENPLKRILEFGGTVDFSTPMLLVARNGSTREIVKSGSQIHDRVGHPIGVVLIFRDVTEKQRFERERQKTEKLESLGVLAGGFAHDFNNILTSILGNISLAESYAEGNARVSRKMEEAANACLKGKELTNHLLTFSKGGAPIRKAGSIAGLLEETATFALTGSNVRCVFEIPRGIPAVDIDAGQMSQVIHNLVLNADQAMPDGGVIRVKAETLSVGAGGSVPEGTYVKITISDQGCGIPQANLEKIFDPYFTTKEKGSGLGLAISYFIVRNHGGRIMVSSEEGVGTTFEIYLPVSSDPVPAEGNSASKFLEGKGRILVMDDEKDVRAVLGEILGHIGYEVELAREGSEAVEMFRKAREKEKPFDAAIVDLTVPGGMGGKETVARLLELDPDAKVIVSSGYSNDPVMANYRKHGFRGVVAKPYKIQELNDVVRDVLSGVVA